MWRPETASEQDNGKGTDSALADLGASAGSPDPAQALNGELSYSPNGDTLVQAAKRLPESASQVRTLPLAARRFDRSGMWESSVELFCWSAPAVAGSLLALIGVVGLVGEYPSTSDRLLDFIGRLGPSGAVEGFRQPVESLVRDNGLATGLLVIGVLATVSFASGYVRRLRRTGRRLGALGPGTRSRLPATSVAALIVGSLVGTFLLSAIVLTGLPARAAVEALGHGDRALAVWSVGKWPLIAASFSTLFVILYCVVVSPKPPGIRAVSAGQLVTVAGWALALAGLAFYLAHFNAVNSNYGGFGAALISLLWLTMLSVLYYVTPSLRFSGFGAVMPGLALALAGWLAASAAFALAVANLGPFDSLAGGLAVAWLALVWLWASNLALLFGSAFNVELDQRMPAAPDERPLDQTVVEPHGTMDSRSNHDPATELARVVSVALRDEIAHRNMWSVLPGDPGDVPALLSELECDLNDWGFAYGVAWAVAKAQYPFESETQVAARALEAAESVFREYCAGDDWPARLAERRDEIAPLKPADNGRQVSE